MDYVRVVSLYVRKWEVENMESFHSNDGSLEISYGNRSMIDYARRVYGKVREVVMFEREHETELFLLDYKGNRILKIKIFCTIKDFDFIEKFDIAIIEELKKMINNKLILDCYDEEFLDSIKQ